MTSSHGLSQRFEILHKRGTLRLQVNHYVDDVAHHQRVPDLASQVVPYQPRVARPYGSQQSTEHQQLNPVPK